MSHSRVACELTTSRCELVSGRHSSSKAHPSFASAVCIMVCCSLLYMAAMVAVVTGKHQWLSEYQPFDIALSSSIMLNAGLMCDGAILGKGTIL